MNHSDNKKKDTPIKFASPPEFPFNDDEYEANLISRKMAEFEKQHEGARRDE